ncbi:MAG: hypothetical protein R3E50_04320 [Halioglobus sp.]
MRTEATVQHDSQATGVRTQAGARGVADFRLPPAGSPEGATGPAGPGRAAAGRGPDLAFHQLSSADFDTVFRDGLAPYRKADATPGEICEALERTYCHSIGAEFMHIVDTAERH